MPDNAFFLKLEIKDDPTGRFLVCSMVDPDGEDHLLLAMVHKSVIVKCPEFSKILENTLVEFMRHVAAAAFECSIDDIPTEGPIIPNDRH